MYLLKYIYSYFRLVSAGIFLAVLRLRRTPQNSRRHPQPFPKVGSPLIPPGVSSPVFKGFVSSKHNEDGMQAEFFDNLDGGACCTWVSTKKFEGFPQVLHGGITIALLDELSAYAVFQKFNSYSVTLSCNVKWKGKISIGTQVYGKAEVVNKLGRLVEVKSLAFNHKKRVVVEMNSIFLIPTKEQFKKFVDLSVMPDEAILYCGLDSI